MQQLEQVQVTVDLFKNADRSKLDVYRDGSFRVLMHSSLSITPFLSLNYRQALLNIRKMSTRTYSDAIDCLNSLQSNKATLDAVKAAGGRLNDLAIPEMVEYWERIHDHKVSLRAAFLLLFLMISL